MISGFLEAVTQPKNSLLADPASGVVAGLVATKITKFAQAASYKPMRAAIKKKEERASLGPPPQVAAEKTAERLCFKRTEKQAEFGGMAVHYGLGAAGGPIYGLLRRYSMMPPLGAGFVAGAAMSRVVDETLTPALGFSAPSRSYPTITHVRGLAGHLVFGVVLALTAEAIYRLTASDPDPAA